MKRERERGKEGRKEGEVKKGGEGGSVRVRVRVREGEECLR